MPKAGRPPPAGGPASSGTALPGGMTDQTRHHREPSKRQLGLLRKLAAEKGMARSDGWGPSAAFPTVA